VAPSVQRRKVWLTPTAGVLCSNAAKTQNPLKLAGMPQTTGPISATSGPKFTILCTRRRYCCLTRFFPIVDMCLSCKDIARQSCTMVPCISRILGDFLGPGFPANHVQHISDMHSKFALRPYHVWEYGRRLKKNKLQDENIMSAFATQGGHKQLNYRN